MAVSKLRSAVFCATAGVLLSGCGGRGMVDLRAVVRLDGEPLEGAAVTLIREDGLGRSATGISEADGSVRFTTFEPLDGVLPGAYRVTVNKAPGSLADEFEGADMNDPEVLERYKRSVEGGAAPRYVPTLLPRVYLSQSTSPLRCTAPPESSPIVFELSSDADQAATSEADQ